MRSVCHPVKNLEKYDLKSCRHCGPAKAMPKFQIHPLKSYLKSCSSRYYSPAEAMPKFQILPSQKLRKNMISNHAAADTAVQWKLCPNLNITF